MYLPEAPGGVEAEAEQRGDDRRAGLLLGGGQEGGGQIGAGRSGGGQLHQPVLRTVLEMPEQVGRTAALPAGSLLACGGGIGEVQADLAESDRGPPDLPDRVDGAGGAGGVGRDQGHAGPVDVALSILDDGRVGIYADAQELQGFEVSVTAPASVSEPSDGMMICPCPGSWPNFWVMAAYADVASTPGRSSRLCASEVSP